MRSIWSGAISFGLINIPVKLYPAVEEHALDFDMLRRQALCPIRYARVCRDTGEEVPYDDIVKGYEYRKGDYVVLEDTDFKAAAAGKSQTIDISEFVNASEIDPKLFEKPYYLEPSKQARNAYGLLREALKKTGKVGVGRFVLRNKERPVAVRPEGDLLVLEQMRFLSEIREPAGPRPAGSGRREQEGIGDRDKAGQPAHGGLRPGAHARYVQRAAKERDRPEGTGQKTGSSKGSAHTGRCADLMAKLRESLEQAKKRKTA